MPAKRFTSEEEEKICKSYKEGWGTTAIAKEYKTDATTIARILKRNNTAVRPRTASKAGLTQRDEKLIVELYESGKNGKQLAKQFFVSDSTIYNVLRKNNIVVRPLTSLNESQEEKICNWYSQGKKMKEIAAMMELPPHVIRRCLHRNKAYIRSNSETQGGLKGQERENMAKQYKEGISSKKLAEDYGVSQRTILNTLRQMKVSIRTRSEAQGGLSEAANQHICELYTKGETTAYLADRFNVSDNTIRNILKRHGHVLRPLWEVRGGVSPETEKEVCNKYQGGAEAYELAAEYEITPTTVYNILRRQKVNLIPRGGAKEARQKKDLQRIKDALIAAKEHLNSFTQREFYILFQQRGLLKLEQRECQQLVEAIIDGEVSLSELFHHQSESDRGTIGTVKEFTLDSRQDSSRSRQTPQKESQGNDDNDDCIGIFRSGYENSGQALELVSSKIWAIDDEEAFESLAASARDKIWNHAYNDERSALDQITKHQGNKWSMLVRDEFLSTYKTARNLEIPGNYCFHAPRLMQLVAAAEAISRRRLLILSGMGAGKTLAAELATRADNAELTWIVCPNNSIDQWKESIDTHWTNVEIIAKESKPNWKTDNPKYLLMNFERFSSLTDGAIAELFVAGVPDAIVIDEVQFAKQRTEDGQSKRRRQLQKAISAAREINKDLMVLGMSGTPILNNLREGQKLIELIFGEERSDLPTDNSVHAAMRMFQEFTRLGIRQRTADIWPVETRLLPVNASHLLDEIRDLRAAKAHLAEYEKALLKAKLPLILQEIKGPTLIVTEFVDGIVEPLQKAIKNTGLRVGIYTGQSKDSTTVNTDNALDEFKKGFTDVLIGSGDCMGTGIDGLQHRCKRMIFATLPWTEGELRQIQARLARSGQEHEVEVIVPQTYIEYMDNAGAQHKWSFCERRWNVIASKRTLSNAAVDGILPRNDERLTPVKALRYLEEWIARLEREEIVQRYGRAIVVPLVIEDEAEQQRALRRFGDFSLQNARWNRQHSAKTHERLNSDPQEWEVYQTQFAEARKTWQIDPVNEVIQFFLHRPQSCIGDFGCGTALLANALRGRHKVYSFDHIAINDDVIACDIGQGVPIKDQSLDYAVFALSLMGSNWRDYLVEAYRCLKPTGQIIIWNPENQSITSELPDALQRAGFKIFPPEQRWKWWHCVGVWMPTVELVETYQQWNVTSFSRGHKRK